MEILVDEDYIPLVCLKSWRLNWPTEMKETTTPGSGYWKEFRPRKHSYTITATGLVQVADEDDRPVLSQMFESQKGFLPVHYRLKCLDNSGSPFVLRGTIYVSNSDINSSPIALLNATIEFTGTGELFIEYVIPVYFDLTVAVTGEADAKVKLYLINAEGEVVYSTAFLEQTEGNGGWILQGGSVTFRVLSGQYYIGYETADVNSADNDLDVNTPGPNGPLHVDFDENPLSGTTYPTTLHDFTANRTATFTIGEELPPPVCIDVTIIGSPALPDGQVGIPYSYSFNLSGTAPFGITINNRPAWLQIGILGNEVVFFGTPNEAGEDVEVDITLTNCSAGSVNFSGTMDVAEESEDQAVINWSFTEDNVSGSMVILMNDVEVVSAGNNSSGSFNALPGDEIQAIVGSGLTNIRSLEVSDSVVGGLFGGADLDNQSYIFTVIAGRTYTITGLVEPGG